MTTYDIWTLLALQYVALEVHLAAESMPAVGALALEVVAKIAVGVLEGAHAVVLVVAPVSSAVVVDHTAKLAEAVQPWVADRRVPAD